MLFQTEFYDVFVVLWEFSANKNYKRRFSVRNQKGICQMIGMFYLIYKLILLGRNTT